MHITGMTIQLGGRLPFADGLDFRFDKHVNVFAGPNASGKSSLLRMLGMPVHDGGRHGYYGVFQYICQFAITVSEDWPVDRLDEHECAYRWAEIPWVQIPATRLSLPWSESGNFSKPSYLRGTDATLADIFRHGYDRDIFDGNLAEEALELLASEAVEKTDKGGIADRIRRKGRMVSEFNLKKAVDISYRCAKQITSEVVTGAEPSNLVAGESDFARDLVIRYPDVRLGMAVDIADGDSVAANYLSSGTQSSLLWLRFLALQMLHHYNFEDEWEKRPAILLIDEIENHLHPTWQRRVIPALLEYFPGLQIFATTHSPFVVAGLRAGQVHMLKRDADGVVTASTNEQDIIGWTTDEILRTFMGVDEPTDQLTINRRERLLELRRKDSLSDEEAAEMEELRRQVNEDFLSSSTPLEAQRERYGDMMLEFLRSRQSELSQDGD
ncbi:MAG: AAA family ATPase [Chloroflexota bacterium]|nr:AAA family ATPase [Chloroflexota bacterium]MDE2684148.1 AAA family ATPase [Chloroflexota bacterium]